MSRIYSIAPRGILDNADLSTYISVVYYQTVYKVGAQPQRTYYNTTACNKTDSPNILKYAVDNYDCIDVPYADYNFSI